MQDALRDKIEQLFEYRAFHELYRMSGASAGEIKIFHEQLVELQAGIYDLDAYLESVWDLKEKIGRVLEKNLFGFRKTGHTV
ncbi:MAG: hypothetical protein IPP37_01215 [Saprospiraceae bacterium]|nr:hypothetical protein [Saprospiraceae bacterium]